MMKPIPSTAMPPSKATNTAPVQGSDAFQAHLQGLRKLVPLAPEIASMEIEQAFFGGPDLRDRSAADIQNQLKSLGNKLTQGQFSELELKKLEGGLTRYAQKLEAVFHDHPRDSLDNSRAVHTQLLAMSTDCRKALEPPESKADCIKPQTPFDDAELFSHPVITLYRPKADAPQADDRKNDSLDREFNLFRAESRPMPADQPSKLAVQSPSELQLSGEFENPPALNTEQPHPDTQRPPDTGRPLDTNRTWVARNDTQPAFDPVYRQHGRYASMSMPGTHRPSLEEQRKQDALCEREADALLQQVENRFAIIDSKKIALLLTGVGQDKRKRIIHGLGIIAETNKAKGLGKVVQELTDMQRAGLIQTPRSGIRPFA